MEPDFSQHPGKARLANGWNMCLGCYFLTHIDEMNFRGRIECACHIGRKFWEDQVAHICAYKIHGMDVFSRQFQHPQLVNAKTSHALYVDLVGMGTNLCHLGKDSLPLWGLECLELQSHFPTKHEGTPVFDMTIEMFIKTMFFWERGIPFGFINIHDFVSLENIRKQKMSSDEADMIAEAVKDFVRKVHRYNRMRSKDSKQAYYIEHFMKLPAPRIRLKNDAISGHDETLVQECVQLIQHAHSNTLSNYAKRILNVKPQFHFVS